MRLAVFGASVSAQTRHHITKEITGYVEVLRTRYMDALGVSEIRQITYEGNRLSDGGLVRLADLLEDKPDICLFEPLIEDRSRGQRVTIADFRYAYTQMLNAGILPVTVLLPRPWQGAASTGENYNVVRRICADYDLPVIEVDVSHEADMDTKFKGIHTLLPGAEIYARQVYEGFTALRDIPGTLARAQAAAADTPCETYVQKLLGPGQAEADLPNRISGVELRLNVSGTGRPEVRLIQQQQIGPFSPMLDVRAVSQGVAQPTFEGPVSVWDRFCHYPRASYVVLGRVRVQGGAPSHVKIAMSRADPDYASCAREVADWPLPDARYMQPLGPLHVIATRPFTAELVGYDKM